MKGRFWLKVPLLNRYLRRMGNLGISRVAIWKHVWQTFWQNTKNIDVYIIILYVWVLTLTNNVLAFEVFMSSSSLLLFGCSVQNSVLFLCKSRLFLVLFVVLNTVWILPQSQNKLRDSKCPKYVRQQHCLLPSHANDLSWPEFLDMFIYFCTLKLPPFDTSKNFPPDVPPQAVHPEGR